MEAMRIFCKRQKTKGLMVSMQAERLFNAAGSGCGAHHGRTADQRQQPADQRLQLLDQDLRGGHQDRLQAGQGGQLDALVGTRQRLQQQRQELEGGTRGFRLTLSPAHCREPGSEGRLPPAARRLGPASAAY